MPRISLSPVMRWNIDAPIVIAEAILTISEQSAPSAEEEPSFMARSILENRLLNSAA